MRAVDAAGHWSPWVEAVGTSRIHPFDDRSPSVTRSPSWRATSSTGAYQATLSGSSKAGAKVNLNFTGHAVALVTPRTPHLGKVRVYIDGVYSRTVSLKTATSSSRQVVCAWYFPSGGAHTITLRVVGTGTYPLVRLDAIVVSR